MLDVGLIGIGNAGNQVATLAAEKLGIDVFAINSSRQDFDTIPDSITKKLIGDEKGAGKNRADAKAFLKKQIMELMSDDDFKNFMSGKEVVYICSSTGGGTGSGIAPIMSSIIRQAFRDEEGREKPIILIGVLPKLSEGQSTQVNTLEYLHEVYDVLADDQPTYMLYDNNKYAKESSSAVLQKINADIISDIKVMKLTYNTPTPFDSIDEKDMKTICFDPGRIVVASAFNIKEKDLDEVSIEDLIINNLKINGHAEIQRDGIVSKTGLITNLSEKLNDSFDSHLNKVRGFIGEPVEEFLHIAINKERDMPNNVALIISGLSKIDDRIDKIEDRIKEIEERQKEQESTKRESSFDEDEIANFNAKKNVRSTTTSESQADLKGTFAKFGL